MKAPEKLYIALDELTEDGRTFVLDHRIDYPICTEYIRTDAFIKKALKFIKTNVDRIVNNQHGVCIGCMDEEFRKYMKGE